MSDDDFPLLGEPLALELINTWYGEAEEVEDFLHPADRAARWCQLALGEGVEVDPVALRALRDALRRLLVDLQAGRALDADSLASVNRWAAGSSAFVQLRVEEGGQRRAVVQDRGGPLARLATSGVEVLCGPDPILQCEGPGCTLFFVQHHGRRRFCHEGCSHRARQQRYARRQR